MSIVYRLTNIKNEKSYIGFTTNSLEHRWRQHLAVALKSNTILANAIKKYGKTGFKKEILYESTDATFTKCVMEEHFIRMHNTHCSKGGYNMTFGGDGVGKGTTPWNKNYGSYTEGRKNPMFGKRHNENTKAKISQSKTGSTLPRKGVTLSDDTKQLLRKATDRRRKTYIVQHPNGTTETTSCLKDFCTSRNLNLSHMIEVAQGKHKHHKGFRIKAT